MVQLHQDHEKFTQRGAHILVVVPDSAASARSYWDREALPFTGLLDADHAVADQYGQEVNLAKFGRMPAMFVLDKTGHVRYSHYGESMADIPRDKDILALLDTLNAEPQVAP